MCGGAAAGPWIGCSTISSLLFLSACECDADGSTSPHCAESGLCPCKDGNTGRRCSSCLPGYTWRGGGVGCTGTQTEQAGGRADNSVCYVWLLMINSSYQLLLQWTCVTRSRFVRTEEPALTSSAASAQTPSKVKTTLDDVTGHVAGLWWCHVCLQVHFVSRVSAWRRVVVLTTLEALPHIWPHTCTCWLSACSLLLADRWRHHRGMNICCSFYIEVVSCCMNLCHHTDDVACGCDLTHQVR